MSKSGARERRLRASAGRAVSVERVRGAYGRRAGEYEAAVGRIEHVEEADLALVARWATGIDGPILDVGCGPGQWTDHLRLLGADAEGIDPTTEFIELARETYPESRYRIAQAEALGVADGTLGGVLAWYSLIHTAPDRIGAALTEFARCLRPGGGLLLGFFAGERLASFDHAITTAHAWPIALLAAEVEAAGFSVVHTESREIRPGRTHGALLATR